MTIRAICFTEYGKQIINRISTIEDMDVRGYIKCENAKSVQGFEQVEESLSVWARKGFEDKSAIVFVGAMGIAVRAISECVKDKLTDSPVIVIDDKGQFVIPVLSGHVGGANELAITLADTLEAIPVVTTSTDSSDAFAVDLWASENNLRIINREGIKKVSAKSIEGKCVTLSIKDYPPAKSVDVIVADECRYPATIALAPKKYVVGMGLKRGKSSADLEKALESVLDANNIDIADVGAIATIDIKLDEEGLKQLVSKYRIPLLGFESSILERARGEFSASAFVKDTVGVDNVCERAAVVAANQGELVVKKQVMDGITVAVARKK